MSYTQRGYLTSAFRLFRLEDTVSVSEIDYHFHDFHKLLFFRGGTASYCIEGRHYPLEPGDVVLVPKGCVHRPEAGVSVPYSRDVLYLSASFLQEGGLEHCFALAAERKQYVLRLADGAGLIESAFLELEQAQQEPDAFAAELLQRINVQRLLILLTRLQQQEVPSPAATFDSLTARLLQTINDNLTGDIRADALAAQFYVSKYHLMRRFRQETGYSIHQYISSKRLLFAREMISAGVSPTDACFRCGFRDYSAFARAYRKQFAVSPRGG